AAMPATPVYPTLALAYFTVPGLPKTLQNIPLGYFPKALGVLRAQPGVDPLACPGQWGVAARRGRPAARRLLPAAVNGVVAGVPSSVANPTPLPQGGPAGTGAGRPAGRG